MDDGPISKKPRLDEDILNTLNDTLPDELLFDMGDTPGGQANNGGPAPGGGAGPSQGTMVGGPQPQPQAQGGPIGPGQVRPSGPNGNIMPNGIVSSGDLSMGNNSVVNSGMGVPQQQPGMPPMRPQQPGQIVSFACSNPNINLVNALTTSGPKMQGQQPNMANGPMMSVGMTVASGDMNTVTTMNNGNIMMSGQQRPMGNNMPMNSVIQQQPGIMQPGGPRQIINRPIMMQNFQQRAVINRMPNNVRMQQNVVSSGPQQQFMTAGGNPVINASAPGGAMLQQRMVQPNAGQVMAQQVAPVNLPPRYPSNQVNQQQPNSMAGPNQPQPQQQAQQQISQAPGASPAIQGQVQNAGPPAPTSADPEKRKLIQQQLVLLLHAHKCQRRDREITQSGGQVVQCNLPHCRTMKNVLNHMTSCTAGKTCPVAHCSSSRQIIAHWKHCNRPDCPVCLPLKQADNNATRQRNANAGPGAGPQQANQQAPQLVNQQQPNVSTANGPPSLPVLLSPNNQQPQPPQQGQGQQQQGNSNPSPGPSKESMERALQALGLPTQGTPFPGVGPGPRGPRVPGPAPNIRPNLPANHPNASVAGNVSSNSQQPSSGFGNSVVSQAGGPGARNSPSQLAQELMEGNNDGMRLPNNMPGVSAAFVAPSKEWHSSVTDDLRNHLVHKLVQAIFPMPDPSAMLDKRMHNLVAYARKVEGDMYSMANSKSEYYHLLAEKIYKIQKELEEKRIKRKQQQQQPGQGGPPGPGVPPTQGGPQQPQQQMPPGAQQMNQQQNQVGFNRMQNPNAAMRPMNPGIVRLANPNPAGPNSSMFPNQPIVSLDTMTNTSSSVTNNPMLRHQLESNNSGGMQQGGQSKLVQHLTSGGMNQQQQQVPMSTVSSSSGGNTILLSQLAKTPVSDPNPNVINKVAGSLANKLPNETLPGVLSNNMQQQGQGSMPDTDIKREIKQESDIKKEVVEGDQSMEVAAAGKVKSETDIKREIKSEPGLKSPDAAATGATPKKIEKGAFKVSFTADELKKALEPSLLKMCSQDEAVFFREPVDPTALGIPDYFQVIKKPMDMSSIKQKLDNGVYKDPWEYVDDVWLMFENAWVYNKKNTKVYKYCTKLSEIFETEIDPVMQSLGYCCGRKYTFSPQTLVCYGQQNTICTIARDAGYFIYENKNPTPALFSDKYCFCQKCFNGIQGDMVSLCDDPSQPTTQVPKTEFLEKKNDHLEKEKFVKCDDCSRNLHQICVLHFQQIWNNGFTCDNCHKKRGTKRKENKFTAKRLAVTRLGTYIETRVNNFLRKKEADSGEVYIRVVYSGDKTVEVKQGMKKRFVDQGTMNETFPYRARALFAFEEIDGVDVCFFGMHVQEYGSDSPAPNTRRVYIAYLDSVHFFKPRHFRTSVYHEILLGYLDYMKKLGYTLAHIWACPPSEGDDYIFHCHPPDQKIPKPKRLQEWYKKMLDKGIIERIVLDYKDIYKQALEDNLQSPAELPYFDGDFWPNVLEENIRELEQEEEARKKEIEEQERLAAEEAAAAAGNNAPGDGEDSVDGTPGTGTDGGKKGGKKKNQKKKKSSQQRKNQKKNTQGSGGDLTQKVFATMEKHKEVFFTIRLHSAQSAASLSPIQDPDPLMSCDLMDGRDAFLTMAREKNLEFSSLRRVKFSSMVLLYELHTQGQDKFVYTCNTCDKSVETRFHCTVCEDFDLCVDCYNKPGGHPHKMEKLGFGLDAEGSDGNSGAAANPGVRQQSIQRCIQSLVHACQCRDANCRLPSCHKMKRVVGHTRQCKRKTNGGCPICKQLIALCCYHAKLCQEANCPVPFCSNIKQKLRQQQLQQRLQEAAMMRRRIARMNQSLGHPTTPQVAHDKNAAMVQQQQQPQQPQQHMQPGPSGMGMQQQQNVGGMAGGMVGGSGKPGGPGPNVLEAVKKVQEEAHRQSNQGGSFGKGSPQVMAPMQSGMGQGMNPQGMNQQGMMNQGQWQMQQPQRYPMQQQRPMGPGGQQGGPQVQGGAGTGGTRPTMQSLQQLIQALKSPSSQQQQQQVLSILKSNPSLMAAFIKQRTQQQNQQGGNQGGANQMTVNAQAMISAATGGGQAGGGMGGGPGVNMGGQMPQGMIQANIQGNQQQMGQQPMNQQMMQQQRYRAVQLQQQQPQQPGNFQGGTNFQQPAPPYSRANMTMQGGQFNPQGMMPPQGMMQGNSAQQMLSQVRSPPPGGMPVRSPQPGASPRPGGPSPRPGMINSPRNQPIPSPRHPMGGGGGPAGGAGADDMGSSQMMLGQPGGGQMGGQMSMQGAPNMGGMVGPGGQDQDGSGGQSTMTPQDQLSKFVETL